MKFKLSLLAAALLAAFSSSASAADMAVKAPPAVAPVVNWTGGYIGAFAGYHWGRVTQSGCAGICPTSGDGPEIWVGGVQAGYDWQMPNNWVIGVQARIPVVAEDHDVTLGGAKFKQDPKFQAFISGRLGYAMNNWLPYVVVGGGFARNELIGPAGSDTATHVGLGAGLGIEYRLARNWSLDLRYMYVSFSKETYNLGGGPEKFGDNSSNVLAAINYRF
jgi:outer membrane immunogenic protein